MEELNNVAANTEEVAAPQDDSVNLENSQEDAELDNQSNQEQPDVTQTQAFAHRLKEEKARARDELIAEMYGEEYGIHTYEQYQQAVAQQQEEQRRKYYQEQGVDPDLINKAIEEHPDVQYAREMKAKEESEQRFNNEALQLFDKFPDLKPNDIPPEVFQMREQQGIPLLFAYQSYMFDKVKTQTEQETIRKLSANATSSPGSLGEGTEHTTGINNMSKTDFDSLVKSVLRGERKSL